MNFTAEFQQIEDSSLSIKDKYIQLKRLLEISSKEITATESLQFPSLFSRIVFISQKYKFPKSFEWHLQHIRVTATFLQQDEKHIVSLNQYQKAKNTVLKFWDIIFGNGEIQETGTIDDFENSWVRLSLDKIRVQVVAIDEKSQILICKSDSFYNEEIIVKNNVNPINNQFDPIIERLWIGAQLNLIDVKIDEDGYYIPKNIVLEPDYLIDASAIAECFQSFGSSYLHYFRRKFEQPVNSHYILLGNLANFFLDELIYADEIEKLTFEEVFLKSFRQMPFEYASCKEIQSASDFKDFMVRAKSQFNNIKRVVRQDMPANGFNPLQCTLEPSFFCEKYGFQGRLDLLQLPIDEKDTLYRIIELKSGKTPYPREDKTKIALNHEVQTAVYRLMIQSVFKKGARDIYAAILYSSSENKGENVRLAASYQQLERQILNIRNQIVATEHDLYTGTAETVSNIFKELFNTDNYGRVPDFFIQKLSALQDILNKTSELEREYFYRYISFISRELYLQKVGDEGYDSSMSTSALWNTTFKERKETLDLICNLEIEEVNDDGSDMKILFRRSDDADCVNFREGEICILYPRQNEEDSILSNQILKGNIVEITSTHVLLRFRYKQKNKRLFFQNKYWVVEHDKLDHAYIAMFRGLSSFLSASKDKRNLLLGLKQPESSYLDHNYDILDKHSKQEAVIQKALAAKDYFLIVGPPGTGKTSVFARRLIEEFYLNPKTRILLIAYTNRAVDELCAAICKAFNTDEVDCDKYIRIGTELSCSEQYRHRLLQNISQNVKSRAELLNIINSQRIVVGTLASIIGKPELFDVKGFNVAIIDEASQILEPQIVGLLPNFDRFIMIGDHKQLSTITLQNEKQSKVDNPLLNEIQLDDCRESLFERLYRICKKNNWITAYDTLTFHGRMHQDIATFVDTNFYDNSLQIATQRQAEKLFFPVYDHKDFYQKMISEKRLAFVPARKENNSLSDKINEYEAEIVTQIVHAVHQVYIRNNKEFDPNKTIGIITPYRNQIALIKQKLKQISIPEFDKIMVDTVERYQGSQRDIIIISCCFNRSYQLKFFSNMNREGTVDRKLNVALTRAREQLFIVGNDYIMQQNAIYRKLINFISVINEKAL